MNIYEDANKLSQEAMDNALKSLSAMSRGFQQITTETSDFTKQSYERHTAMIEKLMQAKTPDKVIEVQNEYARGTYEGWMSQMTRLRDLYAQIAKETYRPFEQATTRASNVGGQATREAASESGDIIDKKVAA
ncbi:phasin family protein [Jiella sp. M17.18]|uniref:phasin family protein n=1 Tax=Jiella sp. M17.18 TaxID=3234247 RepID=UPI0034DE42A0